MVMFYALGGKQRPVFFGMSAMFDYEQTYGTSMIGDLQKIGELESGRILPVVQLIACGLRCGCRKEGLEVDFSDYDVAEWVGENLDLVGSLVTFAAESMPQAKPEDNKQGKNEPKKK